MKPTRLYIKRHAATGMLYFGKTVKSNINQYHGSGKYWKNHIKEHGLDLVETIWISEEFTDKELLIDFSVLFSDFFEIVNSSKWANLKEENGLDGHPIGLKFSDETRQKISKALTGKKRSQEVKDKLSASLKNRSSELRKQAADAIRGRKRKPFSEETKRKNV